MNAKPSARWRWWASVAFVLLMLATLWWRWTLVGLGPDPDSDAYGHHAIARQILVQPTRLAVHWVWLPLFHWLQVPLVALGMGLEAVRRINVVIWALVPLSLFLHLRRDRFAVAVVSASLVAVCPIGMQMGTTGQPEPLFALAVLWFAIGMQRQRFWLAAGSLGVACLLRYEAWSLVVFSGVWLLLIRSRKSQAGESRSWAQLAVFGLPCALILGWALLRLPGDGRLFGFIHATGKFAREAQGVKSVAALGASTHIASALHYPLKVALNVLGWSIVWVPLGLLFLWREQRWFFWTGAGCLGFISLSWIMRSSLGLDRHFVSVVPFYAVASAAGMAVAAHRLRSLFCGARAQRVAASVLFVVLSLGFVAELSYRLQVWMGHWRYNIEHSYPDRIEVAAFLRRTPSSERIFCDESTVEIISGLDRKRFDRRGIQRAVVQREILRVARRQGGAYVATWAPRLKPLLRYGTVVFRPKKATASSGMAVLRIDPNKVPASAARRAD